MATMSELTAEEIRLMRAIAERPQAFTSEALIHEIVRKGIAVVSEGRGVVLTAKGEQMLMSLPRE